MSAPTEVSPELLLRLRVEDFLYREVDLLDNWQLEEWLTMFDETAHYVVPSTDTPRDDERSSLALLNDDMDRLRARVRRLNSRRAHREFPWSRTRHLVTNVRVRREDGELHVNANFAVYRLRGTSAPYVGRYLYRLVEHDDSFLITYRRAELDLESLDDHGTVSFLL